MTFQVNIVPKETTLVMSMIGLLDEEATLPELDFSAFKELVLDLNSIRSINSYGIRSWLTWIKPIADTGMPIVFERVPSSVVFQFNMVKGFLPEGAQVRSVYVRFYCEKCDIEKAILLDIATDVDMSSGQPKVRKEYLAKHKCPSSSPGCNFELEYPEETYLAFLRK